MRPPRERGQDDSWCVPHTRDGGSRSEEPSSVRLRTCARCGGPLPMPGGRTRNGTRYCSATCRHADVRERRAAAYEDLIDAVGQLVHAANRIQRSLRVMGFFPTRRRARGWRATERKPHSSANVESPPVLTGNTSPAFPSKSTKKA